MDKKMVRFLLTIVCGLLTIFLTAQDSISSKKPKRLKVLPVPAFGYAPETKSYAGVVTLFTFKFLKDTAARSSNAKLQLTYTARRQMILESEWNLFGKDENWFSRGRFNISKYPDRYYGIGPETPKSAEVLFSSNRLDAELMIYKKIGVKLFAGLGFRYINFSKVSNPGNKYDELKDAATFGSFISLIKDNRNSLLTPTKGFYLLTNLSHHQSSSNYFKALLDLRYYKTWKKKYTLANRFVNQWNTGNPPFFDMALLSGDQYVRGFYFGRYRDMNLSALQTEFRIPVWWRFGLAAFGGLSSLYPSNLPQLFAHMKYNAGIGLRFLVEKTENTSLRLDYAIGQGGNSGFYVAFGESF